METENINTEHHYVPREKLAEQAKVYWGELKDKELKMKDRGAIPIQEMPVLEPHTRASLMDEVATGYTEEQARIEAERCLNCKNRPCVQGCPVGITIHEFITFIQ